MSEEVMTRIGAMNAATNVQIENMKAQLLAQGAKEFQIDNVEVLGAFIRTLNAAEIRDDNGQYIISVAISTAASFLLETVMRLVPATDPATAFETSAFMVTELNKRLRMDLNASIQSRAAALAARAAATPTGEATAH